MVLKPQSRDDLARALALAGRSGSKIAAVDLSALSALVEHRPEDMTATVEGGMNLAHFQAHLRAAGQWLPMDPAAADAVTIADLVAYNLSGPRRCGYGTIRDYLIGIRVALANGDIIFAGGKVVKNVAGYDLCKLFVGARHTLGVIVEATFKLRPLPESEVILEDSCESIEGLCLRAQAVIRAGIEPVILDGHNVRGSPVLVVGLAGAREDVEYQQDLLRGIGRFCEGNTEYDSVLHHVHKTSVCPSGIGAFLKTLGGGRFVARLGNGTILHEGDSAGKRRLPNADLMKRVKDAYDPARIFPEYTL